MGGRRLPPHTVPNKKKPIAEITLELNEKQRLYLKHEAVTIEGLGVKKSEYNRWLKEPLFGLIEKMIENGSLSPEDQDYYIFDDQMLLQLKSAILLDMSYTYEEIEKHLNLKEETLIEWMNEFDAEEADVFRYADNILSFGVQNKEPSERDDWDKRDLMIPLILQGKNNQEIAEELGVSRQTVSWWRNHDADFKDDLRTEIKAYRDTQRAKFAQVLDKAYQSLEALLDSSDPAIKLKAAVEILKSSNK